MRSDYTLDDVRVICPNASLIADGTRIMKRGKCFTFQANDAGHKFMARSLGRVNAGPCDPVKNHIFAMVLSADLRFAFIRWVDPASVTMIFDAPTKLAEFFFAPNLPYDATTMIRLIEYGTVSDRFIEHAPACVQDWNAA